MKIHRTILLLLITASQAVVPLFAADKLIILTSHWEGYRTETERAFQRWYRENFREDVVVDWRDVGGSSDMLKFVQSEYQQTPAGIGIDIFFGGGVDPYFRLKDSGFLESYQPPENVIGPIPKEINGLPVYDPDYQWFGTAISGFGILSNKRVVKIMKLPDVKTWEDLTDPALFSWVASGDPRASGSAASLYEIILQAYGWDKGWSTIIRMAGNIRAFNKNASMAAKEVTFGDAAYCLAIDVYGLNQVSSAGPENIGFIYPVGLTIINPDAMAILKGAPDQKVARRFVDFMLSSTAQSLWVLPKGSPGGPVKFDIPRMSILPGLYHLYPKNTGFINPFTAPTQLRYNSKLATSRRDVVQGLIGATIIDLHSEVVPTWKRINDPALSPAKRRALIDEFVRPPLSSEEVGEIAQEDWKDPAKRNQLLQKWQNDAVKKYRSLLKE